jgi:hypothetical protein
MANFAAVDFDEIRPQLKTLDQVREDLATTEPLAEATFGVGSDVRFRVSPDWNAGNKDQLYAPVDAHLRTSAGAEFRMGRMALLEAGAAVGIPRRLQERMRASDLESMLNWWFGGAAGNKEFKVLSREPHPGERTGLAAPEEPLALAMCRGSITPFPNLGLLDILVAGLRSRYGQGAEVLADYKFGHTLERTDIRLLVPGASRVISGTRVEGDDTWCAGVDLTNSLTGIRPSILRGYLFRWWCTNGNTENLAETPQFRRKGNFDLGDVYAWARESVDQILGGLEGSLDSIQRLTEIPVGDDVVMVLRDLFARYNVPVRERQRIIAEMADSGGARSMYDIMNAITFAANAGGLSQRIIDQLQSLGGHVAAAATDRCTPDHPCCRLLPEGWTETAAASRVPQNPAEN